MGRNTLGIENPITANNLWDAVIMMVNVVRFVAIPFLVLAIMWAGFLFIKAQGSSDQINEAKKVFFWTLVATLIILSAIPLAELLRDTIAR